MNDSTDFDETFQKVLDLHPELIHLWILLNLRCPSLSMFLLWYLLTVLNDHFLNATSHIT